MDERCWGVGGFAVVEQLGLDGFQLPCSHQAHQRIQTGQGRPIQLRRGMGGDDADGAPPILIRQGMPAKVAAPVAVLMPGTTW